jgi:hypothetical protein
VQNGIDYFKYGVSIENEQIVLYLLEVSQQFGQTYDDIPVWITLNLILSCLVLVGSVKKVV